MGAVNVYKTAREGVKRSSGATAGHTEVMTSSEQAGRHEFQKKSFGKEGLVNQVQGRCPWPWPWPWPWS